MKTMAQSRLQASLRAFRHRNYRLFFAGQLTSLVGTWMQTVAQSWLVYRLTGSATLLGVVGFASQFPIFLFAPLAGAVADMYPRRRTMIIIQILMMLLAFPLAALTLTHRIQVWHIMVVRSLLLLLGVVSLMGMPYSVLMPIFADDILMGGPKALGLLMGFAGIGALL